MPDEYLPSPTGATSTPTNGNICVINNAFLIIVKMSFLIVLIKMDHKTSQKYIF